MPLQFGVINEPLPVVIIADSSSIYYTWDLKTWWLRTIGVTNRGFAYDSITNKFAVAPPSFPAVPNFIRIATGTGAISNQSSAWVGVGTAAAPSTIPGIRYANENWFITETRYIHKYPVNGSVGARYSIEPSVVMTDIVYDAVTSRYIISGGINNYHTTDFSSFTTVANGFPASSTANALCVGASGRIVVVGQSAAVGKVSTSDNGGSSWTARILTPPSGVSAYRAISVIYVSQLGLYFLACQSGLVYSSADAITWTHRATLANASYVRSIGYSQKLRKVFAIGATPSALNVMESTNGTTWVDSNPVRNDNWVLGTILPSRGVITR